MRRLGVDGIGRQTFVDELRTCARERLATHQCLGLGKSIRHQNALLIAQWMAGPRRHDELHGDHMRTLVQPLEKSMLRIRAGLTPKRWRRVGVDEPLAVARHGFAIAFENELLQIGW